ncbi:hypothetical protein BN7_5388 [Wickerhamomyces ciferrii]|uniref:Uncharacterized protein n=1 Tax=Wickerhamomyces ciferrii (strain ATCC 14091 / BCRC 22168 / CBS 111 / JCM 3599 / NBRC 0793 / NRRL Y-1031 F-60-10) TaxID=1206466 RepID=K0KV82_WICCF|nr:uncharacterized protein BN7_5388 [Wickerhamomyces ciferrii]CCH45802.1 hypothetical protein BN7_5388 [Wickerhamomyces ciferrii]
MIINCDSNIYLKSLFNSIDSIDEKFQKITKIVKPIDDLDNLYDVIQLRVQITEKASKNVSNLPQSIKNWIRFVLKDKFHNGCITIYKKKTIPMIDIIKYLNQEQQSYGSFFERRRTNRLKTEKKLLSKINEYPSFIIINQSGLNIETDPQTKKWFVSQLTKLSSWIDINFKNTNPWELTKLIPQFHDHVTNDVLIFTKGYNDDEPVLRNELFQNEELSFSRRMQRFDYQLCKYITEEEDDTEEGEGNLKDDSDMSSDEDLIYGRHRLMNSLRFMSKHMKMYEKRS